ncbi:MAG TPA: LD-carboxypeptidase [Bacteroidia bacterium]|nr:LD-carboxypeptidase [Bacteroidia bacterium]
MKSVICPPFLQRGDTIGICAPARKVGQEDIEPAVKILESWGLFPVLGKNLFGADNQFSGTDAQRAEDLQEFLNDPAIKAVISARGGYGTMRIIDRLDFTGFAENPKWIIGYSDITVLHSHVSRHLHCATMHATMPYNFNRDPHSTETLRQALFGVPAAYRETNETDVPNRAGTGEGVLVGGNLSLLFALQGSASDIETEGKILFLEDLDEYLYHIDRMVLSLKRARKLEGLKGLIIGGMHEMKDNPVPYGKTAEEIIAEQVAEYDYPVCYGFPAGHGVKNYALQLGKKVRLDVETDLSHLTFL